MPYLLNQLLKEIGFNEKEIAAYLASLECGTSYASHIARKANMTRTTCYAILDNLIKYGLVNKSGMKNKFQFTAENPEKLLLLIEEKESRAKDLKNKFSKLLPELKSLWNKTEEWPTIRFLEGVRGMKSVYEDTFKSLAKGSEYWHFTPDAKSFIDLLSMEWVNDFVKRRVKKDIRCKVVTEKTAWTEEDMKKDKVTKRQTVFLPKGMKIPARLHIYNNKVAIFSLKKERPGVFIEDEDIANLMKTLFQALWEKYK